LDDSELQEEENSLVALKPKSVYISHAVSHFYEPKFEIWDGFGPHGSTEISTWVVKYATFEGNFVMISWAKENLKIL
jgi:hypothetical protein